MIYFKKSEIRLQRTKLIPENAAEAFCISENQLCIIYNSCRTPGHFRENAPAARKHNTLFAEYKFYEKLKFMR